MTIDAVLAADECARLMAKIDEAGPAVAPISTPYGFVMNEGVRNNERAIFDDHALAAQLFASLEPVLPKHMIDDLGGQMAPVGANERFRCYRYQPGQYFKPHYDGWFERNPHERSRLTLMVYLNDDFTGGGTRFLEFGVEVAPRAGMALVFQHPVLHEGCTIERGVKYVLRSDVMYRRLAAGATA
jgi:predicted 2-oxoglutarate/Fe(II)-dependent dioxygenase YbiX